MLTTPVSTVLLAYCVAKLDGSVVALIYQITKTGFWNLIQEQWIMNICGTIQCWKIIGVLSLTQMIFMRFLPGCSSWGLNFFPASILIDLYLELVITLVCFGFIFCGILYIKGVFFPSTVESDLSGNVVFDFFWGTELYPRVLCWDVKVFTNCRFGLMLWQMLIFSGLAYQQNTYGEISFAYMATAIIQTQYLFKFYLWEKAYTKSMDIAWDRAGFYICWGCIAFVFVGFNTPTIYLAMYNVDISREFCAACILLGVLFTWLTYWADMQKEIVRETEGKCLVFGKKPEIILAKYKVGDREEKVNILLVSGFWGWARQFHCILELLASLAWTLPALFNTIFPWIYLFTLCLVVIQHVVRDEWKNKEKYGKYWEEYSKRVPYRVMPYII
ncbi:7-dehydrocholesterol reductase [Oopsacas minuta]|uniref:7-dehydrocholesterol reductase n=1 Tax=Oopsacas minuta TaxID=111878 RepID=A0AAV7JYW7_9METZ|nr:7-dehydrocholesterol reductase [Oopsacas minuta]